MATHPIDWQDTPPAECRGGVLTIGNFDGVHRGHAALVREAQSQARALKVSALALTFDPHPIELLRPDQGGPPLTTLADRCQLLQEAGADQVAVLRTTAGLLQLSAHEFFHTVIRERFQAKALVEGANFGFGRRREGNVQLLGDLCRAACLGWTVVPPQQVEGVEVSSSRVRQALVAGNVKEAAILLGRAYRLHGTVVVGARRGHTIGFPTANLAQCSTLVPGDGVYAVRALTADGRVWPAAANIGPNPTFHDLGRKIEVHLIGFQRDLVGQALAVDLVARLRDVRTFAGVPDLIAQLRDDVAQAARLLVE